MQNIRIKQSFFDRIGKYIILFSVLGIIAAVLTFVTVNLTHYLGGDMAVTDTLYFNINVMITYLIGFIVTPLIILYVTKQREKVIPINKAKRSNKAMLTTLGKAIVIIIIVVGVGIPLAIFLPSLISGQGEGPDHASTITAPTLDNLLPLSENGSIKLTWQVDPSSVKLKIYRSTSDFETITDATLIKTLLRNFPRSYTDTVTDGTYYYAMIAVDTNGAETELSNVVSVTAVILNTQPNAPAAPILSSIASPSTTGIISLTWQVDIAIPMCKIYRASNSFTSKAGAVLINTVTGSGTSRSGQDTITVNGIYYYAVTAVNTGSVESVISNVVSVSVQISGAGATPPTVDNIPTSSSTGIITLTWQVDPTIPKCRIYRASSDFSTKAGATVIATPQGTGSARIYTDTVTNGIYYYAVTAVTATEAESELSNKVYISVTIVTQPTVPASTTLVSVTPQTSTNGNFVLTWTSVTGAAKYLIYRATGFFTSTASATKLATEPTSTTYADTIAVNGPYYYGIIVVGTNGLSSVLSNVIGPVVMQMPVAPTAQYIRLDESIGSVGYGYYSSTQSQGKLGSPVYIGLTTSYGYSTQTSNRQDAVPTDLTYLTLYLTTFTEEQLKTWLGVSFLYNSAGKSIVFYGIVAGTSQYLFIMKYYYSTGEYTRSSAWAIVIPSASETKKGLPNIYTVEYALWAIAYAQHPNQAGDWIQMTSQGNPIRPVMI